MSGIVLYWPTEFCRITQGFGERPEYYRQFGLPGHEGVDFEAHTGSPIHACAPGTVAEVAAYGNYGSHVRIDHAGGYQTTYAHLVPESARVQSGERVQAGQVLGLADSTGNSSASHLHLTLKGPTSAAGYPSGIMDPSTFLEPYPRDWPVSAPLAGLHDGADYLRGSAWPAWAIEPIYLSDLRPVVLQYSGHDQAGVRVVVRLNYSYAKADGGKGTYPVKADWDRFVSACVDTIRASYGVWGWIIGNEPNSRREWPDDNPILPSDVAYIVNAVWRHSPAAARISPPALDPYAYDAAAGPALPYWRALLADLTGCEITCYHAVSFGLDQTLSHDGPRFGGFETEMPARSWGAWRELAGITYRTRLRRTPCLIAETSVMDAAGTRPEWTSPAAAGWVSRMLAACEQYNAEPGDQYVHAACLFRYSGDATWRLDDKPHVLQALKGGVGCAGQPRQYRRADVRPGGAGLCVLLSEDGS